MLLVYSRVSMRPSLGATRPDPALASDPGAASERDQILVRFCSRRHAVRGEIWVICLTCCAVKCVLVFDQELRCLIPDVPLPPIIILAKSHHIIMTIFINLIAWKMYPILRSVFWRCWGVAGDGHLRAVPEVHHRHLPHRDAWRARVQRGRQPRARHSSPCAIWQGLAMRSWNY